MEAYDILVARGVSRLCHFTLFKNLTHILSDEKGILASNSISPDTRTVNDRYRHDGLIDHVCCSIQYPNSWFLENATLKNEDSVFQDWVVVFINLKILDHSDAQFCPCNASKGRGYYINSDMTKVDMVFADSLDTFKHPRPLTMLSSCPTDGQAEILIRNNVPRSFIIGLAVADDIVAKRLHAMLLVMNLNNLPIYVAPDIFTRKWSRMVRIGVQPNEYLFSNEEES